MLNLLPPLRDDALWVLIRQWWSQAFSPRRKRGRVWSKDLAAHSRNLFSSGGGRSDKHGWGSDFADIIEVQIDLGPVDFGPE